MNFVQNILWNSVEGFVEAGTRTAGGYAGDALIKAGDLIENSGRSVGSSIERTASGYGTKISGEAYTPSPKALPSTARRPIAARSNSSPASTKAVKPTSRTPVGAKKYPGGTGAAGSVKQITSAAKSTVGGAAGGAQKAIGGSIGTAQKTAGSVVGGTSKALPKPYPNNQPYGTKTTPSSLTKKSTTTTQANNLPKPYPSNSASSYQPTYANANTEKKTAVKPGKPKDFKLSGSGAGVGSGGGGGAGEKKPYPGTNTYPGQDSKSPVKAKTYKALPRLQGTSEGGKVEHIKV